MVDSATPTPPARPYPERMDARLTTLPAAPDREDEDAAGVLGEAAVLLDGAGIPARFRAGCHHSVAWYSHTLAAHLLLALQDAELPLRAALAAAIGQVAALHAEGCRLEEGGPSATVLAVRRRGDQLEHLVLADSSLLLEGPGGEVRRLSDDRVEHAARAHRSPEAVEALRNAPGGFWVARHEPTAAQEALVGSAPLAALRRVHLVSDGVTRAVDLLGMTDDVGLAAALDRDPGALLGELRAAERALAPERRPRKIHDDATVLPLAPQADVAKGTLGP